MLHRGSSPAHVTRPQDGPHGPVAASQPRGPGRARAPRRLPDSQLAHLKDGDDMHPVTLGEPKGSIEIVDAGAGALAAPGDGVAATTGTRLQRSGPRAEARTLSGDDSPRAPQNSLLKLNMYKTTQNSHLPLKEGPGAGGGLSPGPGPSGRL